MINLLLLNLRLWRNFGSVEELEELDVALAVGSSSLGFLLEELPLDCAVRDCGWRWLDLILEGHVAPQELALHVVVVEDVEPQRLVPLGVDALVFLLVLLSLSFLSLSESDLVWLRTRYLLIDLLL